ncbi:ankyrin repeat-containing domain protein [Phycomyces blakesleeanus]|uniref:Ankyrin repeat-containing domain protein n=1 Tax=Phycomyces blakesleeanus TaxID=4837 RepID=A0ABR3AQI6_PHYBL
MQLESAQQDDWRFNHQDSILDLIQHINNETLRQAMKSEIKHMAIDHARLVNMLKQRTDHLEFENAELKIATSEHQRRYEKAVREMQFFKKRFEKAAEMAQQQQQSSRPRSLSIESGSSVEGPQKSSFQSPPSSPLTDTQSSSIPATSDNTNLQRKASTVPSVNSSGSSGSSVHSSPSVPRNAFQPIAKQHRVDPLTFGGSDSFWETIAKSKSTDSAVEKIISNFLRRGGSPNTANQTLSSRGIQYGYGLIHAAIAVKAITSLELLLQHGANPNAMSLAITEEDKISPCYLAASVGWLPGLQALVQAGGDLMTARGYGQKGKTALHVAAEKCHLTVVEYISSVTHNDLALLTDNEGNTALHYAAASGHTGIVTYLIKSCHIPPNQPSQKDEIALHWAARSGRLEVVTLLVERCGSNVNAYVPRKLGTSLDLAKAGNHKRVVDYLKGAGAVGAKKMDKRREEELAKEVPGHLAARLAKNGLFFS